MSSQPEQKPKRTVEELQAEYTRLCTKAGHVQYQIENLKKDLAILDDTRRDLNFEAARAHAESIKEAEEAAKKVEAEKQQEQPEVKSDAQS